ncbi:retrovirus-related pol polyprotein from transposon TNT 1-94 [Tanacetum coccineum]
MALLSLVQENLQTTNKTSNFIKHQRVIKIISQGINIGTGYDNQRAVNVVGAREIVGGIGADIEIFNSLEHETNQWQCAVPIRTSKPKQNVNQSVATSSKKTVATDSTVKKSRNITRKLYEQASKTCSWWYPKYTPPGYNWKPKSQKGNVNPNISMPLGNASRTANILEHKTPRCSTVSNTPSSSNSFAARRDSSIHRDSSLHRLLILLQLVEIVLFIVDSGCSKHMTGNLKLLTNFVEKFLGTVKFGNDQIAPILGYGDLVQGTITIKRVYYVEGLNHNLFSVGQFCDADLEVAFRKSTCYIRDLKGNDLLTGSRGTDLYSISLQDSTTPNPICLMAKATSSQAWLWHHRLSHLNFNTINLLLKNNIVNGLPKLKFVKDYLFSSCELGKAKRMSKDETPGVLIDFLTLVQRGLHAQVTTVRTDKGTEFLNKTLHAYFAKEGIRHETSTARTPEQNGIVERRNRTLVEAARTMLSAAKVPLFFWAEACWLFYSVKGLQGPQSQEKVPQIAETVTTSNEMEFLNSWMFSELLNGTSLVVSKSSVVHAADNPDKRQQHNTTHTSTTTDVADPPPLNIHSTHQTPTQVPTVTAPENIIQADTNTENA